MVKERVSLTLDQDVVDRIDQRLEQKGFTNRSQGIEHLLKEYLKRDAVTDAVILAGGDDPNALININGRPVLDHILDHLEEEGVRNVIIAAANPAVEDAVSTDRDITVDVIVEENPQGTAGALRRARDKVKDTFLVMNGDVLCQVDLADMTAAHEETDAPATMALTTVKDSTEYGVIRMKGNQVVGFQEKPDETFSHLINAGIYLLDPTFLDRIPAVDEQRSVQIEDIFEQLADEGQLNGYVYEDEWREIGEQR